MTPELGAGTSSGFSGTKYNILFGQWRKTVAEGTPGAVDRINKNNVKVWEMCYDNFSGYIKKIQSITSDFGPNLCVTMTTSKEKDADITDKKSH